MIWENATLLSLVEIGKDELGNSIQEDKEVMTLAVRFAPWTQEDVAIEDREVTLNQRKIVLRTKKELFPKCEKIKLKDDVYEIKTIKDLYPRYVTIYGKKIK